MKIELRKIRLAAVSFLCGVLFCVVVVGLSSTRPSTPRIVATGPVIASAQSQPQPAPIFLIAPRQTMPGISGIKHDPRLAEQLQSLPRSTPERSVDLIDTRHQPVIDLRDSQ